MNKKKLIITLLSILLSITIIGCGIDDKQENEPQNDNEGNIEAIASDDDNKNESEENSIDTEETDEEDSGVEENTSQEEERLFPRIEVLPVDEGAEDPSFKNFRDEFISKLEEKDLDYLIEHMNPDIRVSFGDTMGIEGFKEYHGLNKSPEDAKVWGELIRVLQLGGKMYGEEEKHFVAPYTFELFPEDIDAFQYSLITDSNVNVRKKPDLNSEVIDKVSYEVVKHFYLPPEEKIKENINGEEYYWEKVTTSLGKEGYVFGKYVRSPIDYRAFFSKDENGVWKLDTFVAGD